MSLGQLLTVVVSALTYGLGVEGVPLSCAGIGCSPSAVIYKAVGYNDINGNCFTMNAVEVAGGRVTLVVCAMRCLWSNCAFFATDGDECFLTGIGFGNSKSNQSFLRLSSSAAERNIALDKSISCSSVSTVPEQACDEANNGISADYDRFFHSQNDYTDVNPWVVIDLGASYSVHKIRFLPRMDTHFAYSRTRDLTFYLGTLPVTDGSFSSNGYQAIWSYVGPYGDPLTGGRHWIEYTLPEPVCGGRYFAVAKEALGYPGHKGHLLEVTEVEVYSY